MKITTGGRKNKIATQQEKLEYNPTTTASSRCEVVWVPSRPPEAVGGARAHPHGRPQSSTRAAIGVRASRGALGPSARGAPSPRAPQAPGAPTMPCAVVSAPYARRARHGPPVRRRCPRRTRGSRGRVPRRYLRRHRVVSRERLLKGCPRLRTPDRAAIPAAPPARNAGAAKL
jgi:hypothetical protein